MGDKVLLTPTGKWMVGGGVAVALGLTALGLLQFANRPSAKQAQPAPAASPAAALVGKISALGRIEPAGEIVQVGGPSGERIGRMLVKEGQSVAEGQPIAYLESYNERLADRGVAQSQLKDALAQFSSTQQYGNAQIAEAQTRRSQADAPKQKELAAQNATIARLKDELAIAQTDLNRFQSLKTSGAVSQRELDDKRLAYQSKNGQLREAIAQRAKIQQEWNTSLRNADAQVQSARAEQGRSQAQIQVDTARSNLALAQARLERTIIRAPQSGQILKVLKKQGEALEPSVGGSSGGQGIVELGNTSQMYVVAEVYETDVSRARVGQRAVIASSAFPGEIAGIVEQVGLKIGKNDVTNTDPAANTDTRVVEVKIRLLNSRPVANLTNLQVQVLITPKS
ncbi:efflux RND transporter periplasmic adaptor subunit [Altericista sp. CCNU0014]|uniref:efflux RND transporter periplasmic adaptor subunit n=1 Tax=Altericista sp. CCNU0014 TaxID=3082949 RepID=UPI0038508A3F